jgi:glycosyltransferase involved in cell wall biosynthesis
MAGPSVTWRPACPLEELVKLMCSSTMVVLPSLREGFGRPLLEAMYCGKPVVASRIPSSCEVAGEAGRYFSLGSEEEFYAAVNDVLARENEESRRMLGVARVDHYAWDRLSKVYRDIYLDAAMTL